MSDSTYRAPEREAHDLPADWDVIRIKHATAVPIQNGVGESAQDFDPDWPRYIRITDIDGPRSLSDHSLRSLPPEIAADAPVEKGDILMAAVGATFGKAYLHLDGSSPACYAGYLVRYRPDETVLPEWAAYWTESAHYWSQVRANVVQSTIQNFSAGKYKELEIPRPPIEEQRNRVTYLDCRTGEIDRLIRQKQALVSLLREQRTALIHRALTKGIDPDVTMKDSGVEWLGHVPEYWNVTAFKHCVSIESSLVDPRLPEHIDRVLIAPNHVEARTGRLLSEESAGEQGADSGKYLFESGDVIYSKIRPALAKACIPRQGGLCSADMYPLRARPHVTPRFLLYILISDFFTDQAVLSSERVAMPKLNRDTLGELRVVIPPFDEQVQLLRALDQTVQDVDTLITKEKQIISRLQELRTSLISEVVIGRIDVRDAKVVVGVTV